MMRTDAFLFPHSADIPPTGLTEDAMATSPPPAAEEVVPPLEPPAPISARFDARRQRKIWLLNRWRETPCWLTSLIVHLAMLILLGLLLLPQARRSLQLVWLLLPATLSAEEPVEAIDILELAPPEIEPQAKEAIEPAAVEELLPRPPAEELAAPENEAPAVQEPPPGDAPREPAIADSSAETDTFSQLLFPVQTEGEYNDVVDQFIEYDVGRLQGAAGARAKSNFDQLGPAAIPALVRGLNKSAYIRASCPVVVIGRKLADSLASSEDSALLQYALDHIGENVPQSAPHYYRLRSLAEQFRKQYISPENLERNLADRGIEPRRSLVNHWHQLTRGGGKEVVAALESLDHETRLAAMLEVQRRSQLFRHQANSRLGKTLSRDLFHPDEVIQQAAYDALRGLTDEDFGSPSTPGAREAWRAFWDQRDLEERVGPRAESLIAMGDNLLEVGNTAAAAERYQQVLVEFPDVSAAKTARQRLAELAR